MLRPEPHVAYQRLVRMFAERRAADEAAIAAVRAELPRVVTLLVEKFGARRVVLFGSLASGLFHHAQSDVDLAVEGLSFAALAAAEGEVQPILDRKVDLVPIEAASRDLLEELATRGEVLHGS